MTAVETAPGVVGTSVKRKEDAALLRGRGRSSTTSRSRRWSTWPSSAARIRTRGSRREPRRRRAAEGVVAAFSGADLAGRLEGRPAVRLAGHRGHQDADALPARDRRGPLPGRPGRRRRRREPALAKDAAELVEVDYEPLPSIADVERALEDGAPLVHSDLGTNECYVWKLETDDVQAAIDAADVVVTRRYFQPRLIPNAIEPRGVLAQVGPTGDVTLWSATQTPHIQRFVLQLVLGIPESKIRVIAPDVGGGFGSKIQVYAEEAARDRPRAAPRPPGEVDGGAGRELRRHDPRPRRRPRAHVRGDEGRRHHRRQVRGVVRDGRLPRARRPASRSSARGSTRARTRSRTTASRSRASSPTRRRPTRIAAPAGRRRRTSSSARWTRSPASSAWTRRAPAQELRQGVPAHDGVGAHDRLGRLRRVARPAARDPRPRRDPRRPGRATANGDAKQIGVGFSTYNEMCGLAPSRILGAIRYAVGGWDAATVRFQPLGSVQVVTGHVAARPEPRDDVRADRRRPARRRRRRRRGAPRRHGRPRSSAWTRTGAARSPSAASRSCTRARR